MSALRLTLQLLSASAGVGFGLLVASSCSAGGSDCNCLPPKPIVQGDFAVQHMTLRGTPPAELQGVTATRLSIRETDIVLEYSLSHQAASATFVVARKYGPPARHLSTRRELTD